MSEPVWKDKDLGVVSAFGVAKEHGWTGTEAEWEALQAAAPELALKSESYGAGTRNGQPVGSTDPAYQNNAQYYAGQAQDAKTAAQAAQAAAEAVVPAAVTGWLAEHITNPDSPPLDRTLSSSSCATPADITGDLKSAIWNTQDALLDANNINGDSKLIQFTRGYYINCGSTAVDVTSPVPSETYSYAVLDAYEGDQFIINGAGGKAPRLWCFLDINGNRKLFSDQNATATDLLITTPEGAAKLVINSYEYGACIRVGSGKKKVALEENERFIGRNGFADDTGRVGLTFPVVPNRKYKLVSKTNTQFSFVFLSDKPTAGDQTVPYAFTGFNLYEGIYSVTFIAPQDDDTKYVWIPKQFGTIFYNIEVYDLGPSDKITVAASNSGAYKDSFDYVCDGENDEVELQAATDGLTNGGVIEMSPGDFYIDSFSNGNYAIYTGYNAGIARTITYKGIIQNKAYNTRLGTTIHVTEDAIDGTTSGNTYSVFVGTSQKPTVEEGDASFTYTFVNNVNFENFYLYTASAFEGFIGLNCINYGCSSIKQVCVATEDFFYNRFHHIRQTMPAVNSIGINSCGSSNDEMALCSYEDLDVGGMYIGYKFNGIDHLVMRNCFAARDVYGFYFTSNSKTQTMINCADEGNTHLPYFAGSGHLTAIDFCIERRTADHIPYDPTGATERYAEEASPGGWKGFISFTLQTNSMGMYHFWKAGSGHNFETINLNHAKSGTTEPTNPEYLERFFDTTNNVWKTWNGSAWV